MPSESFFIENILKPTTRLSEPVNNVHQNHSTPLDNRNRMAFNNMTNIPSYMSPTIKGQEYVNAFMSAFMSAAPRLSQIVQSPEGSNSLNPLYKSS